MLDTPSPSATATIDLSDVHAAILEIREALRDLVAEWEREGELPYRYNGRW